MEDLTETLLSKHQQASTAQSSSQESINKQQPQVPVPGFSGFPAHPYGDFQMYPIVYPAMIPGLNTLQNQEQMNRGPGIYAVPVPPFMGPIAGLPSNTLVPLTYSIPTRSSSDTGADNGQGGQQAQQQQHPAPQRQVVVRRFQIAFQLDLFLILKLAAVIFLFNQDGSRQRLVVLVFFASLVYLYQTGALAPLVQWLSQSMQRAAQPPRQPRPAVRAENGPAGARHNENIAVGEGQGEGNNENRPPEEGNPAAENENAEPGRDNAGNHWWGIVKEIQMIVFGFITSLLPGFHNID